MDPFRSLRAVAAPILRANVDTDAIIPSREMKSVSKTGLADGLFAGWRYIAIGGREPNPEFVLNQAAYAGTKILLGGENFGCGSSREHAVWALQNYGFKAVISSRFADIFRGNSLKGGLLTVILPQTAVEAIWQAVEADPTTAITVDLDTRTVSYNDVSVPFELDDYTRWRLMEGLDDIGLTLKHTDSIDAFEGKRASYKPTTLPIRI